MQKFAIIWVHPFYYSVHIYFGCLNFNKKKNKIMSEIQKWFEEVKFSPKIKEEATRKIREYLLRREIPNNADYTALWNAVLYIATHRRFEKETSHSVIDAALEHPRFTEKQKDMLRMYKRTGPAEACALDDDEHGYCLYDGPDDPDRYLGDGEFDDGPGYSY